MKVRRIRLPLVTVAAAMLLVLVVAGAAGALSCDNCVTSGDIVNGTIQSADIQDGGIHAVDIAAGGITGSRLAPNAKGAVGQIHLSGGTTSTTGAELDHLSVTVPADGKLIVQIDGSFYQNVDAAPGGNSAIAWVKMAICTAAASLSDANCGDSLTVLYSQDADDASSLSQAIAFSITRVLTVTAGSKTYYLNGSTSSSSYSLNLYGGPNVDGATATVEYVPSGLTVTS